MKQSTDKKGWERTNVTNLLRNGQSGIYYARVKVNGKEKWRTLKTKLASVAKLKLGDFEKTVRAQGNVAVSEDETTGADEMAMGRFLGIYRLRIKNNSRLGVATKTRLETAVKALEKTWPGLGARDVRRITKTDCEQWATSALREGTGFVAPKARTVRKGMSPSAFNKCIDALRAVFEIAVEQGAAYSNPAAQLEKAKVVKKVMALPEPAQFHAIVKSIAEAGARQSKDCADMVRFLAYSGARLAEGCAVTWAHIGENEIRIPGTKTETSLRTIPLFPALGDLLKEMRERRPGEAATVGVLRVKECKGALASACKEVGVKRLTHHDLRHLFATRCIQSGVDIPTVAGWLGHSDGGALAMRVYGHLQKEHSQKQALKVNFGGAA